MTRIVRRRNGNSNSEELSEPVRSRVPLHKRKAHWPVVSKDVASTTTMYEAVGIKLVGMVTDVDGLSVGWDLCGACKQHISHHTRNSMCRILHAPAGVVYVYRQRKGIVYEPGPIRGPYIGLRHNPDGSVAPLVVHHDTAESDGATGEPGDDPEPVPARKIIKRRKPVK